MSRARFLLLRTLAGGMFTTTGAPTKDSSAVARAGRASIVPIAATTIPATRPIRTPTTPMTTWLGADSSIGLDAACATDATPGSSRGSASVIRRSRASPSSRCACLRRNPRSTGSCVRSACCVRVRARLSSRGSPARRALVCLRSIGECLCVAERDVCGRERLRALLSDAGVWIRVGHDEDLRIRVLGLADLELIDQLLSSRGRAETTQDDIDDTRGLHQLLLGGHVGSNGHTRSSLRTERYRFHEDLGFRTERRFTLQRSEHSDGPDGQRHTDDQSLPLSEGGEERAETIGRSARAWSSDRGHGTASYCGARRVAIDPSSEDTAVRGSHLFGNPRPREPLGDEPPSGGTHRLVSLG